MAWFQKNRLRFLVAVLLGLGLLLFFSNLKSPREQNWLDRTLVWLSAPLQGALIWMIDGTAHLWNGYVALVGTEQDNQRLRDRLDDLQRVEDRARSLELENQRLTELLAMRSRLGGAPTVGARVISLGTSPTARTLRIDVGGDDGVRVGQPVVNAQGLVGRVSGVVGGWAEVVLVVDSRSAVDVLVERSRDRGIVRGQGEDEICSVDYLRRTASVEPGDRMVTSGIGGTYPSGLLVGTITRVSSPSVGIFRAAEITPAVSFRRLEEVLVVLAGAGP
jgi:rod shape-determining protein MreC